MNEKHDTLQQYVGDMLAVEQHMHQAVRQQLADGTLANFPEAAALINRAESLIDQHIAALNGHLRLLGGDAATPVKEAVLAAAGVAAGLINRLRTEQVSKMLRDDYAAFSLAAISYHMLHTTAVVFDNAAIADVALSHLKGWTKIITDISHAIHPTVARDLANDGFSTSPAAVKKSEDAAQEAWNPSHVS